MTRSLVLGVGFAGLLAATLPSAAQLAEAPGVGGAHRVTRGSGAGPDSAATGYSESGRDGTGGIGGGPTSNGTDAGAGTATGGTPGGYVDRH